MVASGSAVITVALLTDRTRGPVRPAHVGDEPQKGSAGPQLPSGFYRNPEASTRSGARDDPTIDVKTTRSPSANVRALDPNGTHVTVGGSVPRLQQALALGPPIARRAHRAA